MSKKTAVVIARMDTEIKKEAEEILSALGIPASVAVNILYKQIILQGKLPFDVTIDEKAE